MGWARGPLDGGPGSAAYQMLHWQSTAVAAEDSSILYFDAGCAQLVPLHLWLSLAAEVYFGLSFATFTGETTSQQVLLRIKLNFLELVFVHLPCFLQFPKLSQYFENQL